MKKILIALTLGISLLAAGCSSGGSTASSSSATPSTTTQSATSSSSTTSSTDTSTTSKDMTASELKKYNGQNGNPAYVAYKGVIYDVTNARKWNNGKHQNGIVAGVDLTKAMGDAPHGEEVLKGLPVIGKLK